MFQWYINLQSSLERCRFCLSQSIFRAKLSCSTLRFRPHLSIWVVKSQHSHSLKQTSNCHLPVLTPICVCVCGLCVTPHIVKCTFTVRSMLQTVTKWCTDKVPNTRLGCMWDKTATSRFQPPAFVSSVWICKAKMIISLTDANRACQAIGLVRLQVNYSTYERGFSFIAGVTTVTWPTKFYGRLQGTVCLIVLLVNFFYLFFFTTVSKFLQLCFKKSSTYIYIEYTGNVKYRSACTGHIPKYPSVGSTVTIWVGDY